MFATFLQKTNKFPGLPDSLFELSDPVLCRTIDTSSSQTRLLSTPSGFSRQQVSMAQRSKKQARELLGNRRCVGQCCPAFSVAE
jgi:hypothetical protein